MSRTTAPPRPISLNATLAVTRYELAVLIRSQRWMPPVVLVGVVLATAGAGGSGAADTYGFAAAVLVPGCAWLTRAALTGGSSSTRSCLAAAGGPVQARVGCLLAAAVGAALVAVLCTVAVTGLVIAGGSRGADGVSLTGGAFGGVLLAGLVAQLTCALLGVAIGLLCNPPLIRRAGVAVFAAGIGVVLALAVPASPAVLAIGRLSAAPAGQPSPPWLPLLAAVVLVLVAGVVSVLMALRSGPD